jgi:dTDP-4-dehydrorhamnose 3,5-epimerase
MDFKATEIPEVIIIEPTVHGDERGFFLETYREEKFAAAGIVGPFVQDNHSGSIQGTLRGLHYQIQQAQGKLLQVVNGEIFDVAVDLRRSSKTFGKWVGEVLSVDNKRQRLIMHPSGTGPSNGMILRSVLSGRYVKIFRSTYLKRMPGEFCLRMPKFSHKS